MQEDNEEEELWKDRTRWRGLVARVEMPTEKQDYR
jgi:hypothetical protein